MRGDHYHRDDHSDRDVGAARGTVEEIRCTASKEKHICASWFNVNTDATQQQHPTSFLFSHQTRTHRLRVLRCCRSLSLSATPTALLFLLNRGITSSRRLYPVSRVGLVALDTSLPSVPYESSLPPPPPAPPPVPPSPLPPLADGTDDEACPDGDRAGHFPFPLLSPLLPCVPPPPPRALALAPPLLAPTAAPLLLPRPLPSMWAMNPTATLGVPPRRWQAIGEQVTFRLLPDDETARARR